MKTVFSVKFFSKPKSALRNTVYLFKNKQKQNPPSHLPLYASLQLCHLSKYSHLSNLPKISIRICREKFFKSALN